MTVTFLGYLFVPLAAFAFLTGKRAWIPWLLAVSMPFIQTPAVIAGENSMPAFYLVAFAALG
ncbi:hypothetical protein, partial [Escherichia coli]|uniref:hypothetical protein n=1 Tax=Escherichia coli TaxID=562 RepID=UPI0032E44AB8